MYQLPSIATVLLMLTATGTAVAHSVGSHPPTADPGIIVQEVNPWTHLDFNNDPDNFQFAIVADRTGSHRLEVFADAVTKLNLLQPEFVMSVGDLIEGYTEELEQLRSEWEEFHSLTARLEMPFFYTPGNHDITNPVQAEEWERQLGRSYYSFVYRNVLLLCLNTEDGKPSHIGEEQIEFVERTLAENPDVRWTLVFQHKPLWNYNRETGWSQVESLLLDRPHTVIAGHFHSYTKHVRHDQNYLVLATTGGGSSLRGPRFGEFDHVVWVTMTEEGPRIANLLLEGIWDEDIRTAEMAELTDPLVRDNFLGVQPLYSPTGEFDHGTTSLHLSNTSGLPLQVTGRFEPQEMLSVLPAELSVLLAPESEETIEFAVSNPTRLPVAELSPLVLNWEAVYEQTELDLPVVDGTALLVVAREYLLPYHPTPIDVDGSLEEWEDLPFVIQQPATVEVTAEAWEGPADCSWRFGVVLGAEYLYIGVEVKDDIPIYRGGMAWEQDGIEVRLDVRPDPQRAQHRGSGENYYHLLFALGPAVEPGDMTIWNPEFLNELGARATCRITAGGHNTELAIPLSYLEQQQGVDWQQVRLNIAIDDFDAEEGPLAQLWWQPDWRDEENLPGSGTFRRAVKP